MRAGATGMRLSPGYNRRLARFDADLRIRWSQRRHRWLLERRARYQRLPVDPSRYGSLEHDTVVQMREGYFTLGEYQPAELPSVDRLIAYLRTQDSRRRGDQDFAHLAEALADELDANEATRDEQQRQRALANVAGRAGEQWEHDRWAHGTRIVVPRGLPSSQLTR